MGVPPNHPFIDGIFHEINHPAIGVPPMVGAGDSTHLGTTYVPMNA